MNALPRNWWLHGLHLGLAIGTPLILVLLAGCMKAKASKEDLGPAVAADSITQALARMVQTATFKGIGIGQYLDFSDTRQIENQETAITLGARRIEIIDRKDTASTAQFTLRITNSQRQSDGNFLTTVAEDNLLLNKGADLTSANNSIPLALRARRPSPISAESLTASAANPKQRVTFHHLRESDQSIDPPKAVKARADCGGLTTCTLPLHFVQFDMAIWNTDTDYQKISFDFAFTNTTPYLPFGTDFNQMTGVLITDCRSTYVPVDSRTVYVRDCLSLEDFQK